MFGIVRKIIPKYLKTLAWLKYLDKGDDILFDKEDINVLCRKITNIPDVKLEAEHEEKPCKKPKNENGNNQDQCRNGSLSNEKSEK
jgi:hypothetical protein